MTQIVTMMSENISISYLDMNSICKRELEASKSEKVMNLGGTGEELVGPAQSWGGGALPRLLKRKIHSCVKF